MAHRPAWPNNSSQSRFAARFSSDVGHRMQLCAKLFVVGAVYFVFRGEFAGARRFIQAKTLALRRNLCTSPRPQTVVSIPAQASMEPSWQFKAT